MITDKTLMREDAFVNGAWVGGARFAVIDPATGQPVAQVARLDAAQARAAVDAAQAAFAGWSALLPQERAAVLMRWHRLIVDAREDLARIMTAEQGKPLAEARGEVAYAASFLEWFAEEGKRLYGDVIPAPAGDRRILIGDHFNGEQRYAVLQLLRRELLNRRR